MTDKLEQPAPEFPFQIALEFWPAEGDLVRCYWCCSSRFEINSESYFDQRLAHTFMRSEPFDLISKTISEGAERYVMEALATFYAVVGIHADRPE